MFKDNRWIGDYMERILYIFISLVSLFVTILLYVNEYYEYTIVAATITFVCVCCAIRYFWNNRSDEASYKSKVKNILKTYDSIMITSDNLPDISEKNIVEVSSIDDLLDAQIELKKPIYYKEFEDHTVFVLIDNEEACVAVFKMEPESVSPYELYLNEMKEKKSDDSSNNSRSILEDLENTTIIRLNNDREFKVSPIRKEKKNIVLTPISCMINKESVRLVLRDNTITYIDLTTVSDIDCEYDKDKIKKMSIKTDKATYILESLNPNKMVVLKQEMEKRLKDFS